METNKVELKQVQKIDEVVSYLEGLLKGFKEGKIVVRQGESFVCLTPAEQVEIEVTAKKKKDKEKFSLELSWRAACDSEADPVSITSTAPACKSKDGDKNAPAGKPHDKKAEKETAIKK
jgi:amphi-Trp domain-containing protein